ncbi:carotenoid oxygenase family protein [Actinoplanes sp. NBRC 101535]|uniref:carotenoid oxygenase family protein n=1 Tax=Actinoplanes sp. NBRC 101535 TaxID=3032196 RepID=UPI0024A1827E|nr:carotenoid oxygenase family protein [Actinoplanes sp. NBRC 101535]GLY02461.1 carotenoid cleavage dioxygenase [Actinoplanes sp. NBRC 101535]
MNRYLEGNYAPLADEMSTVDLPVSGRLPRDLNGLYLRIGPNPRTEVDRELHHWFSGAGMVHGVRLREGRAEWYRSRFVTSERGAPNTNVLSHGGRLLTLIEGGKPPVEISPDLAHQAIWDCDGTLSRGFTAHPKIDPATGAMHAMTYNPRFGSVRYVVLDASGRATHTSDIEVPDGPMVHDMALTATRVVLLDLPVTLAAAQRRGAAGLPVATFPFNWDDQHTARLGILPLSGTADQIRWIEAPRSFVFHVLNAFDNPDGSLTMDVIRYDTMFVRDINGPGDATPRLVRWTVNPATGTVNEEPISDHRVEFPRVDPALTGRPHRYGWFAGFSPDGLLITDDVNRDPAAGFGTGPLIKIDTTSGRTVVYDYGPGRVTMEPAFVPRPGAIAEDDGWILSVVHDGTVDRADLVVLDAADLDAGPVATVHLPSRVPFGFHGNWVDDRDIDAARSAV